MNCKQDDLAVLVRSDFPENVGALCRVMRWDPYSGGDWKCEALTRVMTDDGWKPAGTIAWAFDSDLRPLRDPGDDAVDQTLLWLPTPSIPQKEEV